MIPLILLLAGFLRFYRFQELFAFIGETGAEFLTIRDSLLTHTLPLLGPPTSHPWLSFGPLFFWLFAPVMYFSRFDPIRIAMFFAVLSLVSLILVYLVTRRFFGRHIAVITALLMAVSPAFVSQARGTRFFSLVLLFFAPFYYFLVTFRLFWSGLFLGIILNFHLSPLIFFPAIVHFLFLNRRRLIKRDLVKFIIGLGLPSLPFLANAPMLAKLALWLPYRSLGLAQGISTSGHISVAGFFTSLFLPASPVITQIVMLLVFLSLLLVYLRRHQSPAVQALVLILGWGIIGLWLHRQTPDHYYLPLYIPALIAAAASLSLLPKYFKALILAIFVILNLSYALSPDRLSEFNHIVYGRAIPYSDQQRIVQAIISNAAGRPFSLRRVGAYDVYQEQYSQNYRYLLWLYGNEPVPNSKLVYTLYEATDKLYFLKNP